MKCVIAGSRDITDYNLLLLVITISHSSWLISEVVCGGARGVDDLGKRYAEENGIPVSMFYADWDKHGMSAGHIRNKEMAEYCDLAICLWDGVSPGTRSMIGYMKSLKKPVFVYKTNGTHKWYCLEYAEWFDD